MTLAPICTIFSWKTQAVVERQFTVIGEALGQLLKLEPRFKDRIAETDKIIAFRNVVVHGYATIDQRRVWDLIELKLPALIGEVERLQEEL